MKHVFVIILCLVTHIGATLPGITAVENICSATGGAVVNSVTTPSWTWRTIEVLNGGSYPITVDALCKPFINPTRIFYLLPASGTNFVSNYFYDFYTTNNNSLAKYLINNNYLVIGITPREDKLPQPHSSQLIYQLALQYGLIDSVPSIDYSFTQTWGIAQHATDVHSVISSIDATINRPFRVLGYSFGALVACEYATSETSHNLQKVIIFDVDTYDPADETTLQKALMTDQAYLHLMQSGLYIDQSLADYKTSILISTIWPNLDSGLPRNDFSLYLTGQPATGNFTITNLFAFAAIWTSIMPGLIYAETGMPDAWSLTKGTIAGTYTFDPDYPINDSYVFSYSNMIDLKTSALEIHSGVIPLRMYRDVYEHNISYENIAYPVIWINTAGGYGQYDYAPTHLIPNCNFSIEPNMSHGDIIYGGSYAKTTVWNMIK